MIPSVCFYDCYCCTFNCLRDGRRLDTSYLYPGSLQWSHYCETVATCMCVTFVTAAFPFSPDVTPSLWPEIALQFLGAKQTG